MTKDIFDNKSSAGIEASIHSAAYDGKCPYLGMVQDPATSLGFPDGYNRCYRHEDPTEITLKMQSILCLTSQFESCAIFQQETPIVEEKQVKSPAKWVKKAHPVAFIIPLVLLLIAAFIWWPPPWTTVEDNTSNAAPMQKVITEEESSPADEAITGDSAESDAQNNFANDSASGEMADSEQDDSPEAANTPTTTPEDDESIEQKPGGFRVRVYD